MNRVPQTAKYIPVRSDLGIPAQVRLFHPIHSYDQKLFQNDIRPYMDKGQPSGQVQKHHNSSVKEYRCVFYGSSVLVNVTRKGL